MTQPVLPATGSGRQHYGMQFLTTPTADTPGTTIALNFGRKRYLFGHVAEGTQRALIQRGFGLRKVHNLFLTGPTSWTTNGGLMGMILTIADVLSGEVSEDGTRPRLHIHGAPKLLHTLAAARRFIFRTGMPLTIHEATANECTWPEEPSYVDDNIRVWSVTLRDVNANTITPVSKHVNEEQAMRARIVQDMFDSDWRRDRLIETTFKDVKLPAMVFIRSTEGKGLMGLHCPNHESAPEIALDQKVLVRNPWPASLVSHLPPADNLPSNISVAYIVRGHAQRGTFDSDKAKALGVKPGPAYRELTEGKSITLENGHIVTPNMVLGPTRVGKGVAIFDLPTSGHAEDLGNLLNSSDEGVLEDVSTAVWILGPGVSASIGFKQLLQRAEKLRHFISDPDTAPNHLAFESTALSTLRLAKINPGSFSTPVYDDSLPYDTSHYPHCKTEYGHRVFVGRTGLKIGLEPKDTIDESEVPPIGALATLDDLELPNNIVETSEPPSAAESDSKDLDEPEIISLGTGSSQPSKYRNVSATLIRLAHGQGNVLLDCGENTIGQLRRTFPRAQLEDILRNTQALWISHLHADHHLGTVSFLQARARAFDALGESGKNADRTIYLMSEKNMIDFIHEYSSVEPSVLSETGLVPLVCKPEIGPTLDEQPFDFVSSSAALRRVDSVRVSHCAGAQAVSITFKSGFKVSYSGDCRPSGNFCSIGADSDVLIHEATFEDEMKGDAVAKKHSTTSEALGVALDMRAKNAILTHFSQRYPKVPNLGNIKTGIAIQYEEASASQDTEPVENSEPLPPAEFIDLLQQQQEPTVGPATSTAPSPSSVTANNYSATSSNTSIPVCIAFDYMRIKVSQIANAKQYYPAIQKLFDLQEAASENKRDAARQLLEERIKAKQEKAGQQKQQKAVQKAKAQSRDGKGGEKERGGEANGNVTATAANGEPINPATDATVSILAENGISDPQDLEKTQQRNSDSAVGGNNILHGRTQTASEAMSKNAQKRAAKAAKRVAELFDKEKQGGNGSGSSNPRKKLRADNGGAR